MPDDTTVSVREVFGMHTAPGVPLGEVATTPGPILAAVDDFRITLIGKGGHAAYPHDATDPIPGACALVSALQTVASRNAGGRPLAASAAAGGVEQRGHPGDLGGRLQELLQPGRVEPAEQPGEHGDLGDRVPAGGAAGEVPLVGGTVGRGERAQDVGAVVVRELAAGHPVTPISASANRSERSA